MNVQKCSECEIFRPGFCPRCTYLMDNMRRWRAVAEQLHAEHCTHQARQIPSSCNRMLEDMYNTIDMTGKGIL